MTYRRIAAALAVTFIASPLAAQIPGNAAPATQIDEDAPPAPLEGVAATFRAPPRDAAGAYITPNRDLSPEETTWHVRVALNVAALGCRDADEAATAAAYNTMLALDRAPLAAASAGMALRYQAKYGAGWQGKNDDNMTRLYNFFAQTTGQKEFCAEAKAVLRESAAVEPVDFARFTAAALPRLEAPFLAFYARYDGYRAALASWEGRHAPKVVIATAAAVPVAGGVPVAHALP